MMKAAPLQVRTNALVQIAVLAELIATGLSFVQELSCLSCDLNYRWSFRIGRGVDSFVSLLVV